MWIILWILFGALIGWIASIITKNNARMGAVANILIGLLGSLVGGFIASLLGFGGITQFSLAGILFSLGGAVLVLLIVNLFTKQRM